MSVISAALPRMRNRLDLLLEVLPRFAPAAATAATLGVGLLLLCVAGGLRRRKRRAWQLATVLAAAATALHLLKGLDVEEAMLSVGMLALLLATRQAFSGSADPRSWLHGAAVLATVTVGAMVAGLLVLLLNEDRMAGRTGVGAVVTEVLLGMVARTGPVRFTSSGAANETSTALAVLGVAVIIATTMSVLRPARGPHPLTRSDEVRLRALLDSHGRDDSLGYFALRRDKAVIFSVTGKAAVGYRVVNGVSLASGDPIGDVEAWPKAIEAWLDEVHGFAWVPAVLGASERGAEVYHRFGLDAFELGDEAVLAVADFSLSGRAMRSVRQAVGRIRRAGFCCRIDRISDLTDAELATVRMHARRWRSGTTERGFSMALGRVGERSDERCVLVRAYDQRGLLRGLLSFVPWGEDGLSLDVMRRDPGAENGLIEFMIAELVAATRTLGICRLSLNFAVFRAVFERGERLGAGPVLRIWRRFLLGVSRFWQIESLYRANAKYRPVWEPRFLCFARPRDLPRVGIAALHAEAFISRPKWPRPRWPWWPRPHTVDPAGLPGADHSPEPAESGESADLGESATSVEGTASEVRRRVDSADPGDRGR